LDFQVQLRKSKRANKLEEFRKNKIGQNLDKVENASSEILEEMEKCFTHFNE